MSQENVEVFMRVVDAYNRRDFDGFAASFDPGGEWYPATVPVEGGEAYIGHRGLERWWANVDAAFQDFQANVEDIRDRDDTIVALGRIRGQFRSGVDFDIEVGWVVRFRDGLAVHGQAFFSHSDTLEAAGLRE